MINFILNNFDRIFKDATSLEALDKLILDLAIRGKLLEQDPNDEPASELLKRIEGEKERLIKEKIIKKEKPLLPIVEDEIPFEIPKSWEWVRLGEISQYIQRGRSPEYSEVKEIPVISQKCIQWTGFDITKARYINPLTLEKYAEERFLQEKDLLWNSTGEGTLGRMAIYKKNKFEKVVVDSHVTIIRTLNMENLYLLLYFSSKKVQDEINLKATGSTKQTELATSTVKEYLVPLPPLEEQKRIVAKVEKLQSIIKDLKEIYIKNKNNRERLKKSLLNEIENQSSDKELLKNLETIFANFDKIIKTKEDIKDIRNLILSLAIKGKLVEQDPSDEPASELLKKIEGEKERLIKEKIIKKEKPLLPIVEDEIPFEIPKSWEWVRLGEVANIVRGGSPRPINLYLTTEPEGINWIKIGDTEKNGKYINVAKEKIKKEGISKSRFVKKGDFLLTNSMSFGRPYISNIEGCVHDGWLIISNYKNNYNIDFLYYLLSSNFTYSQFSKNVSGSVVKNLNIEKVISSIFPLPPIEEQKRIVSKVESLMKICDLLEEKIILNEKISDKLLESILNN